MKVLPADDHPLFLDGLASLLSVHDMDVVGTARDGREALEKARILLPDLILMDIEMPRLSGLEATRLIKAELPQIKIVMLTMSVSDDDLFEAFKSGACGYLLKTDDTDIFFQHLAGLMRGESPLSAALAGRVLDAFVHLQRTKALDENTSSSAALLSHRQTQVLSLVARGLTYKETGAKLFLSERTIKYHMGEILERLHLENRRQAIEYARRMQL